ncbi:MAG TPA: DUF983 domain-containing protein [Candidatus Thermoplasmatota archaeon]|nr:DUF983 domain-containing protein [Candidatus Thermoplasmatota archaeon]
MGSLAQTLRALTDGALLRCPRCRKGRISESLFQVNHRCPVCNAPFEPSRGEFTGAVMFGMGFLGFVALMGYFVLYFFLDTPAWFEYGWLVFWVGVFPLLFYRNMRGAWIGALHGFGDPNVWGGRP